MRMTRLAKRIRGERGSTMVAVVAIMMATAIVGVSISTVTFNALATTSSARGAVQAQTSAESGIAATVAALNTGACASTYSRNATPVYTVRVSWSASATSGFANGCPSGSSAVYLKLVSTGSTATAASGGLQVNRFVEAVYRYTPTVVVTPGVTPSGAAVYSYSSSSYGMTGLTLTAGGTTRPSVILRSGDISCDSSSTINGDLIAANGNIHIANCTVNGDVVSKGYQVLDGSAKVTGNVSATASTGPDGYAVSLPTQAVSVGGSIFSGGPVRLQAPVGGNVTAAGSSSGTSIFQNTAKINGSLTVAGNLNAQGMGACDWNTNRPETNAGAKCIMSTAPKHVDGTISYQAPGLTAPTTPTAPGWTDYKYKAADWPGYTVYTLSSSNGECNWSWESPGVTKLRAAANSTTPTIIDASDCSLLDFWMQVNPVINANMVIVAKSFSLGNNTFSSKNNVARNMWFISSDNTADNQPSCTGGDMNLNGNFGIANSITALAYTPCTLNQSSTSWHGQMYGATVKFNSSQALKYDPVGLPGVNLDTGGSSAGSGSGSDSSGLGVVTVPAVSYRDVSSGG